VVSFPRMETHEVKTVKTEKTSARDLFLRTVAVLGLIAILLLGAWGIIQLAFAIPGVFSNLGGGVSSVFNRNTSGTSTKEAIVVSAPSSVMSGQTLAVSWMHNNSDKSGQYSYALSYACQSGLSLKAPLPNGSFQSVPCNTLFNYVNASQHMNVVPSVTGASQQLAMTVTATKLSNGLATASGNATTNVTAGGAAATTQGSTGTGYATKPASTYTKPAKTNTYTTPSTAYYPAATRATSLYGYGDLAVTITSIAPSNGVSTMRFTIANVGTNIVQAGWTFNATLPISGSYTFGSQPQQALYPGDKIAYTLSFAGVNAASAYPSYDYGYGYNNNSYGYSTGSGYSTSGYGCNGYSCTNNNYVSNGYPNYQYGNYGSNYGYGYQTATITITADPLNFVPEYNKGNNTAQTTIPLY